MEARPDLNVVQSSPLTVGAGGSDGSKMHAYWRVIKKRRTFIAAVLAVVTGLSMAWTLSRPRIYQAIATVVIEPQAPKVLPSSPEVVALGSGNYWESKEYYATQVRILRSRWLALEVVHEHPQLASDKRILGDLAPGAPEDERVERAVKYLTDNIRVLPVRESRIFGIGFMSRDPRLAADLANDITAVFIEQNRAVKVDATHDARRWVAKQLDDARKELDSSETALYTYKKDNNILSVNLEERQNIITQALDDFSRAQTDAKKKRIELEAHKGSLAALMEADPAAAPSTYVAQSPTITALRSAYLEERRKLAALTERYGDKWPEVVAQKGRTDSTLADLRNEGRAMIRSLDAELKALEQAEGRYAGEVEKLKAEAFELNRRELDYRRLSREATNAEQMYSLLLKRLNESGLQERDLANNIRQLDEAQVPTVASEPRVKQGIAFGVMLGVVLALGLAFLLEVLDRTVKTQEDVEALGLSFLGFVPSVEMAGGAAASTRELHNLRHPHSTAAECLRAVRTNILFCGAERPLNSLLVTSSNPLEGKTMTVINLGVTMAQSGQRTLIIDTDMRRPRLHKILGVGNEHGISRLILGDDDFDSAIKSTELAKLFVLPCGPLPPNPAELLQTERFAQVVRALGQRFDRIIFDSPPILAVTDAAVLSRVVNGAILVARAGVATHDAVSRSRQQLAAVGANIVGAVLNDVDLSNPHYTEYYGYASRYTPSEPVAPSRASEG